MATHVEASNLVSGTTGNNLTVLPYAGSRELVVDERAR